MILKEERNRGIPLKDQLKQIKAVADEMNRDFLYLYTVRVGRRSYIVYSTCRRGTGNN